MVSITYDESAKSLYIDLERGLKVDKTVPMGEGKYMDVSKDGKAVGLEIIFARSTPEEILKAIFAGNIPRDFMEEVIKAQVPIKVLAQH